MRTLRDRGALGRLVGGLALTLVGATALAACNTDDDPDAQATPELVDGKVCGFFTPDVIESVVGHDELDTLGDGIGPADERAERAQECDVVDDRSDATVVRVEVTDDPATQPPDPSTEPSADCERPAALESWSGSVCWTEDRLTVLAWPDDGARLINLDYLPEGGATDPDQRTEQVEAAVSLVQDVQDNVEAYDEAHG